MGIRYSKEDMQRYGFRYRFQDKMWAYPFVRFTVLCSLGYLYFQIIMLKKRRRKLQLAVTVLEEWRKDLSKIGRNF